MEYSTKAEQASKRMDLTKMSPDPIKNNYSRKNSSNVITPDTHKMAALSNDYNSHNKMLKGLAGDASIMQWFGFENRIREIIDQLTVPIKKNHELLEKHLDSVDKSLAITCRRIEEHEFIIMKESHDSCTLDGV